MIIKDFNASDMEFYSCAGRNMFNMQNFEKGHYFPVNFWIFKFEIQKFTGKYNSVLFQKFAC